MTNRIDELRGRVSYRVIAERINEAEGIDTTASTISKLAKGEMALSERWIRSIARALGVRVRDLLVEYEDDGTTVVDETEPLSEAVELTPAADDPLVGLLAGGRTLWKVTSRALDEIGLVPGYLILVDTSDDSITSLRTGDTVLIQAPDRTNRSTIILLRQHLEPNLLVTNSRSKNEIPINLKESEIRVLGRVLHHIRQDRS